LSVVIVKELQQSAKQTQTYDLMKLHALPVHRLDLDAVSRTAASMIAANRPAETARLSMRDLPTLESELSRLKERLADRENVVQSFKPEEKALMPDLKAKQAAKANLEKLILNGLLRASAMTAIAQISIKIGYVETDLAACSARIETSEKIAASTRKLIEEWNEQHGADLAELRAAQKLLDDAGADVPTHRW
jgi:hypothetical protein